jgi:peptidoglycan-associated lipoprotein
MKNSTLLALGTALLVAFTAGCRNTAPKTTPLPGSTVTGNNGPGGRTTPDLSTSPLKGAGGATGEGISGTTVPTDLPDNDKLADREHDRARFAGQTVYFEFDRSNVRPGDVARIQQVASEFKALPAGHDLLIEGHCDERGTEEYNRALGERRALAVRELLIGSGLDPQHVFTKSFGKDQPADPAHVEDAWAKNRRGEFILVLPKKITTTGTLQ